MNLLQKITIARVHLSLFCTVLLLTGVTLTACSSDGSAELAADEENTYKIGEPIQDSTLAVIVESSVGADTLSMQRFQMHLQNITRRMPPQVRGNLDRIRKQMIQQYVNSYALLSEAKEREVNVPGDTLDQQIQKFRSQFPDDSTFQAFLAAQNLTEGEIRRQIQESLLVQTLIDQVTGAVAEPTAEEVEEYRQKQAEQVRAQHILFRVGPNEDSTEVKQEAQAVLDSALAGVNFAELARRHSEGPTGQRGGDLGYFSRSDMVPPFSEAVFALSDSGDVAEELVKTRFGYHIIRLTGRRTTEPMDTTQAENRLAQQREREAVMDLVDSLQPKITVRVNPEVIDPEKLRT